MIETLLIVIAGGWLGSVVLANVRDLPVAFGFDFRYYRDVAIRWLEDGTYYWPHQLSGPYEFTIMVDNLYPPPALLLFVPFTIIPAVLWWIIPASVVLYVVRRLRPSRLTVATMLLLMCWHKAHLAWIYGSTDIWAMAAVAGGIVWGWPALLVTLKPTLALFALVGIRRRSWWMVAGALPILSLLMLPMWFDYVTAMANLRLSPTYSLHSIPLLLVPVVAWVAHGARAYRSG